MSDWLIVLLKIAVMFLVIFIGFAARRWGALTAETTAGLSRFVVDVALPALSLGQMLKTVSPDVLRQDWFLPVLGAGILLVGWISGHLGALLWRPAANRSTFIFLIMVANWVYLPLPIAEELYGRDGVRITLLINVGAQLALWTLGIWTLRGGKPDLDSVKALFRNLGLLALGLGIILALLFPGARDLYPDPHVPDKLKNLNAWQLAISVVLQAIDLVGNLTIALSLIVTGAQLGALDLSDHSDSRALVGSIGGRLLLAPLVTVAVVVGLDRGLGIAIPQTARMVCYIVSFMPVAVSCSLFTARFGGDTALASRSIFYSTFLSILSVPALFFVVQKLGL